MNTKFASFNSHEYGTHNLKQLAQYAEALNEKYGNLGFGNYARNLYSVSQHLAERERDGGTNYLLERRILTTAISKN